MAKDDFTFEIIEKIGEIDTDSKWITEVNKVSWKGAEPVYDIRAWNPEHTKCGRGITFKGLEDIIALADVLNDYIDKVG